MSEKLPKSKAYNITCFYSLLILLAKLFLVVLLTFFIHRLIFLLVYIGIANLRDDILLIAKAFLVGIRFDSVVALYGLLLPFVMALISIFVMPQDLSQCNRMKRWIHYYGIVMFILFNLISVVDFYFYKFFQFHINVLFFGIVYDDTKAVLKSVWTDYPVVKILLFLGFVVAIYWIILKKLIQKNYNFSVIFNWKHGIAIIGTIVLYAIGLRGSLGTFPLETEDSVICDNSLINTLTLNGVFALKTAISEKAKQNIDTDVQKRLIKNGFKDARDPIGYYLGRTVVENDHLEDLLISKTQEDSFLISHPPNVIFIQMESFGSFYLDLHTATLNVLGSLESCLGDCIMYRNFLSGTSGTIGSLEGLLVGCPMNPLSQSTYMNCPLNSSVAMPFKDAGYFTNFITSSELGWRNLDKFVKYQHFDAVEGAEKLLEVVEHSSRCEWGVFDEYLFERAFQILKSPGEKAKFIYAMTTTNHTPFELPDHYKPFPVSIPQNIVNSLRTSQDIAVKNFTNFQYANDCLGKFIDRVKNSELGDNTIIAASGDHNTLQLFNFSDRQTLQKFAVPFILYIPKKYMRQSLVDTSRWGSHKDVFPTLFHLALSNAPYINTGVNLLDTLSSDNFGIINYNVAMDKTGCVNYQSNPLYYKWSGEGSKQLSPTSTTGSPELLSLYKRARSYHASMCYYIQTELIKCKQ